MSWRPLPAEASLLRLSDVINLADPDFEPSDAQLIGLSARAFAGIREANERTRRDLRTKVEKARAEALAALQARLARAPA